MQIGNGDRYAERYTFSPIFCLLQICVYYTINQQNNKIFEKSRKKFC